MWSSFFSNSFFKYFFRRKGKAYIIRTCLAYFDPNTTELLHFLWHYICVPSWVYHIFQNCLFRPPIKIAFVVLLDLSKAFDSLDISRLLAKLKTLRVGCTALELFGSYLSGRQQYVRIGAEASCLVAIYNGVSQGSILGPGLFTIFINDPSTDPEIWFSGIIRWWFKTLFVIFFVKDTCSVVQQINDDLSKIASWCYCNSLLINPDKTKLIVLGTRQMLQRLPADFHVTVLGREVSIASFAWDQGLQEDSTLSFDEHITNTVSSSLGRVMSDK